MRARNASLPMLVAFSFVCAMAIWAMDGATPKPAALPRLVLSPNARLELSPISLKKDSLKASFVLEVPASEKYQRHLCLISANQKNFRLVVPKHQQWMLRNDTLTILSDVEMTLLAKHSLHEPLTLRFTFANLDNRKLPGGTATLVLGKQGDAAMATNAPAPKDTSAVKSALVSIDSTAKVDSTINLQAAVADSTSQTAASDSVHAEESVEESGNMLSWILIGLLLSGFAVMALLSWLSSRRTQDTMERIETIRMPETSGGNRRDERAASFESMMRRPTPVEARAAATESESRTERKDEPIATPAAAIPAASVLALTKTDRATQEITALPDLQAALAQLCAVTVEVQKAVSKQYDALQKISVQVDSVRILPAQAASLQSQPRLQFAAENEEAAKHNAALQDLGVKVSLPAKAAEDYEEIADAIASLAAASTIKTPAISAQALTPKLELLRRTQEALQALATFCRKTSTGVSVEAVEALARKVHELRLCYEAWASDQSFKMPLMLQRPAQGSEGARHKIVESLLDGLYETRKIAAQGSLYFERRLSQLLEQDLPKLRNQFSGVQSAELQKIWESMA